MVGGCATFIKQGMFYRALRIGVNQEYIIVEVWRKGKEMVVVNYYNPCRRLELDGLVQGQDRQ